MGVESYKKFVDSRGFVDSMDTMKALMQSIRFFDSDLTDGEYAPGENGINYGNYKEHIPELPESMKHDEAEVKTVLNDPKLNDPKGLWIISHNEVFDVKNKTMSVAVFERFDRYYDYSI